MSLCPSSRVISAPIGRIFMKFDILSIFRNYVEETEVSLNSDKNNVYFVWRPMYIYDVLLNSY